MRADGLWVEKKLNELADATSVDGAHQEIWRAAFTDADRRAKEMVAGWMREAGLETRLDAFGNLCGRLAGEGPGTILVGSHLDTVKNGGRYDGAAGVLCGIAALGNLAGPAAGGARLSKNIEVVAMMEEEGSRYAASYHGSRALVGEVADADLDERDDDGISLREAMRRAGLDPSRVAEARRTDAAAYLELHIEQGPVLDRQRREIGIVENIVGILTRTIRVRGEQNHAGTTPMAMRRDPLTAVCELLPRAERLTRETSETATFTVGRFTVRPGAANVIPGEVVFTTDLRGADRSAMEEIDRFLMSELRGLQSRGFEVEAVLNSDHAPTPLDPKMIRLLDEAARETGVEPLHMNSGAGHDAQVIAPHIPAGMIFVPSRGGISHSPLEYTAPEDLGRGLAVLERALRKLASEQ